MAAARRKGDPKGEDFSRVRSDSITWKWLAGIAVTILVLGGGAWMTTVSTRIDSVTVALDTTKNKQNEQAVEQATAKEKINTIDRKVDEVRKDVSDIRGDIKQILQQQQQILQQQQIQQQAPKR